MLHVHLFMNQANQAFVGLVGSVTVYYTLYARCINHAISTMWSHGNVSNVSTLVPSTDVTDVRINVEASDSRTDEDSTRRPLGRI